MNRLKLKMFSIASCLALLAVAFLPTSKADEWNKKTILTVNESLAIPGTVLQPGKYVLKLADSPADRHIVQVFNEDESKVLTTILAIPNYRLQPTGDTQFAFWEMPAGQPRALKAWFYPGDNFGQEFAYPKELATTIAQTNSQNVPSIESNGNMTSGQVSEVTPSGQSQAMSSNNQPASSATTQARANCDCANQGSQSSTNQNASQSTASESSSQSTGAAAAQPGTNCDCANQGSQSANAQQPATNGSMAQSSSQTGSQADQTTQPGSARTGTGETSANAQQPATNGSMSQTPSSAETAPNSTGTATAENQAETQTNPGMPGGENAGAANTAPSKLPRTASPYPLMGLAGLLSVAGALAVRAISKQVA